MNCFLPSTSTMQDGPGAWAVLLLPFIIGAIFPGCPHAQPAGSSQPAQSIPGLGEVVELDAGREYVLVRMEGSQPETEYLVQRDGQPLDVKLQVSTVLKRQNQTFVLMLVLPPQNKRFILKGDTVRDKNFTPPPEKTLPPSPTQIPAVPASAPAALPPAQSTSPFASGASPFQQPPKAAMPASSAPGSSASSVFGSAPPAAQPPAPAAAFPPAQSTSPFASGVSPFQQPPAAGLGLPPAQAPAASGFAPPSQGTTSPAPFGSSTSPFAAPPQTGGATVPQQPTSLFPPAGGTTTSPFTAGAPGAQAAPGAPSAAGGILPVQPPQPETQVSTSPFAGAPSPFASTLQPGISPTPMTSTPTPIPPPPSGAAQNPFATPQP